MPMNTGDLDRRIVLFKASPAQDTHGDTVSRFDLLCTVWASVRSAPGSERLQSGENAASAPTVFRIRHSRQVAGLNPKDSVEYPVASGRLFDIKSVVEIGRREGVEIVAVGRAD